MWVAYGWSFGPSGGQCIFALGSEKFSLCHRPRGVTVSILDSESSDRGSNPREAFQESEVPLKGPASKENVAKKLT